MDERKDIDEGIYVDLDDRIEPLLEKPYCLVDMLPKQVPAQSSGQYFRVEAYFWQDVERKRALYAKFARVMLKLNCYVGIDVRCSESRWVSNPSPDSFSDMFLFKEEGERSVYVLFDNRESLVVLHDEDTYMTVYNVRADLLDLLRALAGSEGLFVWAPPVQ
ncbi:MAG: hypothetical protein J6T67_00975 [Paludibacteraceae bacterium]|nr:hypothetical protein [Paludibacteraceae bacterium]